jgi:hypothetical protein
MTEHKIHCTKCEAELDESRIVWLELNNWENTYHANEGEVPQEQSQGWFPFGSDCARRALKGGLR